MKVVPISRFFALAAPYRLQGIISVVMVWERRRQGVNGFFLHYVLANPGLSQVDWVDNLPFGKGDSLLDGLPDHTVELNYREAYQLCQGAMEAIKGLDHDLDPAVFDYWAELEQPEPLRPDEWLALVYRLFDRPLEPREVVHAFFQAWAVEDWALAYQLLPKKTRSRYRHHQDCARRLATKHQGESLLRGIVREESFKKKTAKLTTEVLIGKDQFLWVYRAFFYLVQEDGRWLISSIRKEEPCRVTLGQEPFFQDYWYWQVFSTKNAGRIQEMLQQMDGVHLETGERGTAVAYLGRLNDPIDLGVDIARDARGQVWIGRQEIVVGAVNENQLAVLIGELRRERVVGHNPGSGPYRLPEIANYVYREGTTPGYMALLASWEARTENGLICPKGWDEGLEPETGQIGALLTEFIQLRFGSLWRREWTGFARQSAEPDTSFEDHPQAVLFWEWFVFDRRLRGGITVIEAFMREIGGHLAPQLHQAVQAWRENRPGFYLLTSVEEKGYWVRDLFTEEAFFLQDVDFVSGEAPFKPGYLLFARLIAWEGSYRYGGVAHFFPPWYASVVNGFIQGLWASGPGKKPFSWREVWARQSRRILAFILDLGINPVTPKLVTPEGHQVGMFRALYRVGDFKALKATIEKIPEFLFSARKVWQTQGPVFKYDWIDWGLTAQLMAGIPPGSPGLEQEALPVADVMRERADGQSCRQLGTLTLHKQYAVIDTVSRERLEVLKRVLVKYCGFYLVHEKDLFEEVAVSPKVVLKEEGR
ncbi:MAG: hypothetical protein PHC60_06645 [Heliobacteriaceae bacterium]|nr:hypothetical protein [Heliobacteriaceae bacterium]MDD4588046.1 hypothetical protein [Heliobacteriaceae bacterium]